MQLSFYLTRSERNVLTERIVSRAWTTGEITVILGTHLLLFFLASFTGLFFYEEQIPAAQLVITYVIYLIMTGLIHFICRRRGGTWTGSFGMGTGQLKYFFISPFFYLVILPLLIFSAHVWQLLLGSPGSEPELQDVAKAVTSETSWLQNLYIFTAILIAPLFEEIVFRGLLFPYLIKQRGLAFGILMLSLFFALIHFHWPSFVPLALLSALLCFAYWRTGSLWLSIGTHMIFNSVTIFILNTRG